MEINAIIKFLDQYFGVTENNLSINVKGYSIVDTLLYVLKFLFIFFILIIMIRVFRMAANFIGEQIRRFFRYIFRKIVKEK
ncbi:hypothetical protein N752_12990 [Desulforamulus aquiferis]|nr:hypothetical protein N752_12990 [Desulforamulus aquiferis]